MSDAPADAGDDIDRALRAVQDAGAAADGAAALEARRARAAQPDVARLLASMPAGSPAAQRLRAGLQRLGITVKAIDASVKWWRGQRRREGDGDRPLIRIGPDVHVAIDAAVAALASDPDLYCRENALVRVTRGSSGEPVIRPHTAATLRARLTRVARFEKLSDAGEWVPTSPTDPVTLGVLEQAEWPGIRYLAGIIETPGLRPDLSLNQRPGYDEATHLLYLPTIDFPPVPEEPAEEASREAFRKVWVETSHGFPWRGMGYADPDPNDPDGNLRLLQARSHPDSAGIVSAVFTVLARGALLDADVPAHLFSAPTPASGKGMGADVVGVLTTGRVPSKTTWPSSGDRGDQDAEVEKRLNGDIASGALLIVWDEIRGAFGGPAINNALTCHGRIKLRLITRPDVSTYPYAAVMLGMGNNFTWRDNTHRRGLNIRIESPDENPEKRRAWRHEHLVQWVSEHRAELVVAALTVLRGYVHAGCPEVVDATGAKVETWGGGYERWSNLVARAIVWAGGANILGCRPTDDPEASNEERDAMIAIIDAIGRLEPKDDAGAPMRNTDGAPVGITLRTVVDRLYTPERIRGRMQDGSPLTPDGFDDAREAIDGLVGTSGRKPDTTVLSRKIRVWRKRPVAGVMLDTAPGKSGGSARWTVRKAGK